MNMDFTKKIIAAIFIASLASCASLSFPQNATEFKASVVKYDKSRVDRYTVNRSVHRVAKSWKTQAKKCLNVRVTQRIIQSGTYHPDSHRDFRTVIRQGKRTIGVDLKSKMSRQVLLGSNKPADGFFYVLTAEATSIGNNKTRIKVYRGTGKKGQSVLSKQFYRWAQGKSTACPDMIKLKIL